MGSESFLSSEIADRKNHSDPIASLHVSCRMKTNPILRANGTVLAFEIPIPFMRWGLVRFLRSIEGVSEAKEPWGITDELRLVFKFHGKPCVVKEDFGDSDRYWVGPENPQTSELDMTPLHQAFQAYRGTALWRWMSDFDTYDYPRPWEPATAFAAAVAGCFAYISLLDELMRGVSLPVLAIPLALLPVVCCGLFHYWVVRNSGLPRLRQWVQIAGSAFFAPWLGWLLAAYVKGP